MAPLLSDYAPVVGADAVDEIRILGERLAGRRIVNVNSTAVGGGVAEILHRLVPLMREAGIEASWEVIRGNEAFHDVTKAMHNGLSGRTGPFTPAMRRTYEEAQEENRRLLPLDGDVVIIHDPEPAGLLTPATRGRARWVWRCHIDLSRPNEEFWGPFSETVSAYDAVIFSSPKFARPIGARTFIVPPSIDPLSDRNRDLDETFVREVIARHGLDPGRPILTQVSPFDRFKDPVGVIQAYRMVKRTVDAQLVLAGGAANDDPEGAAVLAEVREAAAGDPDVHVLCLPPTAHLEINALQRGSTIILQKSTREGFGLTVTEALWKGKPVIGGAVGGITLQIKHRLTGILVNSVEGTAYYLKYLLANPDLAETLGRNGREYVRHQFLLTRHLRDYLMLCLLVLTGGSGLIFLDRPQ